MIAGEATRYPRHWLRITIGLWLLCTMVIGGLPWARQLSGSLWFPPGLLLTMASGLLLSTALCALACRVEGRPLAAQLPLLIGAVVAAGLVQSGIDHLIWSLINAGADPQSVESWWAGIGFNFLFYPWIFACYVAAIKSLLAAERVRAKDAEIAALEAAARASALAALRYRINPDVLFGALGRTSALIAEKRHDAAEETVQRLADFLRWSLKPDDRAFSSLGDELAALDAYFAIEAVRFGARLSVRMDCHPGLLEVQTPSFLLQPLAEYLVRTGIAEREGSAHIDIAVTSKHPDLRIALCDDCADAEDRSHGELEPTRARLHALYGRRASLGLRRDEAGRALTLKLPLRLRGTNNPATRAN